MFSFTFVIPEEYEDIIGDKVLMQWHYITANNCRPEGYDEYGYLAKYEWLRSNSGQCSLPLSPTGETGYLRPEQFWVSQPGSSRFCTLLYANTLFTLPEIIELCRSECQKSRTKCVSIPNGYFCVSFSSSSFCWTIRNPYWLLYLWKL